MAPGRPASSNPGLTLAAPFLLVLSDSLIAWPWRALELPGSLGNLPPITVALLVVTVYGGARAMTRRLPLRLLTWPPVGLTALFSLMVGFGVGVLNPEAAVAVGLGYFAVFGFVLLVSVAVAGHGVRYAVAFMCFFLMAQALHVPVFEVEAPLDLSGASLLTAASAARAVLEAGAMATLAYYLILRPDLPSTRVVLAMVVLVLGHGPLSAWEQPLLASGELSGASYGSRIVDWVLFSGIQLGMAIVASRLRVGWGQGMAQDALGQTGNRAQGTADRRPRRRPRRASQGRRRRG